MTTKQKLSAIGAVLLGLSLSFAAGRLSRPAQVETRVEYRDRVVTEWRERVVEKRVEGPVRVVTVTRERPGSEGCAPVREVTQTEERGEVVVQRGAERQGEQQREQQGRQEKREVAGPRLLLAVQAGAPASGLGRVLSKPDLLATAAWRPVGPLNIVASVGRFQLPQGKADTRVLAGLGVSF